MNVPMEPELPNYALRILPYAARNLDEATLFVAETSGTNDTDAYANAFRRGFFDLVRRLATLPYRFPVAPEAVRFAPPPVRTAPYQQNPSGPTWRVLYRIFEQSENEAARIEIIAFRHGAQRPLTRAEGQAIDAANQ